jgi:hypothetical protein
LRNALGSGPLAHAKLVKARSSANDLYWTNRTFVRLVEGGRSSQDCGTTVLDGRDVRPKIRLVPSVELRSVPMLSPRGFVAFGMALTLAGCQGSGGAHLSMGGGDSSARLTTGANVDGPGGSGSGLGAMRLKPELCQGFDLSPDFTTLSVADLEQFLQTQGIAYERERARDDLHYLDVSVGSSKARLRVATLDSASGAARDLHKAVLQHGAGSWGTHRSNLAVLAPIADLDQIVAFVEKTKLACWGVLTVAGRDDSFVVPGGYYEL